MRRGPLRLKWFAAFTAATGLGGVADEVARLALPLLVLDITHSIAAAATLRVVQSLPYILFAPPPGPPSTQVANPRCPSPSASSGMPFPARIPLPPSAALFSMHRLSFIVFLPAP